MATNEREIAQKTQEKFEFYVISLVFTLLALSIQTAKFGDFVVADTLELLGWLCLLISGISGLWRLEYIPVERLKKIQKEEFESKMSELRELQMKGVNEVFVLETNSNQSIAQRVESFRAAVIVLGPVIEKLERSNFRKYKTHRYLFVALVCLLASRSYGAIMQLARTVYAV